MNNLPKWRTASAHLNGATIMKVETIFARLKLKAYDTYEPKITLKYDVDKHVQDLMIENRRLRHDVKNKAAGFQLLCQLNDKLREEAGKLKKEVETVSTAFEDYFNKESKDAA